MSDRKSAERAIEALRKPDPSLAHVVNTVRQSLAEVVEDQQNRIEALEAALAAVNSLPDTWRNEATLSENHSVDDVYLRCADELSAALDKDAGQ
jgi:hypothetical protein